MLTSLSLLPDSLEEVPAKSSLAWVWIGFLFAVAFLIQELLALFLEMDESLAHLLLVLIAISGWIYWLFCVSRFHKILGEVSRNQYPISTFEAVGKHFIPFYNLVWVFRWPVAISEYLNRRGRVQMVSGNLLGVALLVSLLTSRFFDGGIGLIGTFSVGMYISAKLRRHLEAIKGSSPEMLPPPPDKMIFGSADQLSDTKSQPTV